MAATPCEGERRKGARRPLNMDVNWPGTPFVVNQQICGHAKSGDNIYASKTAKYNFLKWNHCISFLNAVQANPVSSGSFGGIQSFVGVLN